MKKLLVLFAAAAVNTGAIAQSTKWNLDKSHSTVGFSVDHMVISETKGDFKQFTVEATADKTDFSDLKVSIDIPISSINTDDEGRDGHLKGADFFDAEKYPTIKFTSTSFKKIKGNMYQLKGNITMHGVTKPITMAVRYGGTIKDPYGKTRAGFVISGELDRYDFGLKYNATLEAGGMAIGQKIRVLCSIELVK
jgi:polyisoprenoid-binding protein YceI